MGISLFSLSVEIIVCFYWHRISLPCSQCLLLILEDFISHCLVHYGVVAIFS